MPSLLEQFAAAVARHPERTAIVDANGSEVSFKELHRRSRAFASKWHSKGLRKGDKVLIAMPLGADLYASLAALWSLGATVVLPEPAMGIDGLRHGARSVNVTAICASGVYCLLKYALPELRPATLLKPAEGTGPSAPVQDIQNTDVALISFTSGTSGKPKAIARSHGFLMAQHRAIAPLLDSPKPERDLVAFPVFVLINLASGQTSVLPNWKMRKLAKLSVDHLQNWIAQQNITRALLPPVLCEKLTGSELPNTLHTIFTGGGPVFPHILNRLQTQKPGLRIVCVYGSTEAEPIAHLDAADIAPKDQQAMRHGKGLLVGSPVEDIDVKIVDDEILVAGAHVNSGYLDPADDAENKIREGQTIWHRTGDAGVFDETGRLWLLGRLGTELKLSDKTIYAFSIETMARQWQGVDQCALMTINNSPILVIAGDQTCADIWRKNMDAVGQIEVRHIRSIPMDKRHASKIDRNALKKMIK